MIAFYGNKPIDKIGYNCFSQWFPSVFYEDGVKFYTAEQYMMLRKAVLFNDHKASNLILKTADPYECKKIGREVKGFSELIWKENARQIVFEGNLLKFSQNQEMKYVLLSTGNKYIVEGSKVDRVWGSGLSETDSLNTPIEQWPGTNWLGQCLMEVRRVLQTKTFK